MRKMLGKEYITYHLTDSNMITSYKELKIGRYLEILDACKDRGDAVDTQVAFIAALSGKTEDEILNLPIQEYMELVRNASFITKAPELPENPAKVYEVGGFRLVPVQDATKITTAQYIDFQTLAKKEDSVVDVLSCLLVPEGMKYNDGYDIAEVQKAIREEMSVADAMGAYAFFLRSCRKSTRATLYYSAKQIMRVKMPMREKIRMTRALLKTADSVANGAG